MEEGEGHSFWDAVNGVMAIKKGMIKHYISMYFDYKDTVYTLIFSRISIPKKK